MPWNGNTLEAVKAGLRRSAAEGDFVPKVWIDNIDDNGNGGTCVRGCGWGLVGWFVAMYGDGTDFARRMLPVGSTQINVNHVLMMAGLTRDEIAMMTPAFVWTRFDQELAQAYDNRHEDWNAFIQRSMMLAEGFIRVLERVAVSDGVEFKHLPFSVLAETDQLNLPFFKFDSTKATTLVLSEDEMIQEVPVV